MSIKYSRAALLALSALALSLSACGGKKMKGDTSYIARDVNTLYGLAKERLDKRDYEMAAKLFDEVERQHPYSVWARRAQLMSAFNYYVAKKYPEAGITAAQASNSKTERVSFGDMKTSLARGLGQAKREMDALCLAPDERCQTAAGPGALSSSARTKVSGFTPSQTRTGEEM